MKKENKAYLELIIATFLFSLFGVFTRLIANNLGVFFQLILRVGLMAIFFFLIGYVTKIYKKINRKDLPLFLFRGLLIIIDFSCFYIAVTNLPLGLTLFIFYAANIIMSFVFGTIFLMEKLNTSKILGLIIAIVGLYIMHTDSFNGILLLPSLAALISGFCFGLTTSTSKKLTDKYDSTQVNMVAYSTSFLLAIPLLFIFKESIPSIITTSTILELIGFSIVGVGAFYLTINGFKYIEVQKASLIMLFELLFVIIIGYLFFSETPSLNTIIGGLLVLIALALPNLNLTKKPAKTG